MPTRLSLRRADHVRRYRIEHAQLPHQEESLINRVTQAESQRLALTVTGFSIDPQQDGTGRSIRRRRRPAARPPSCGHEAHERVCRARRQSTAPPDISCPGARDGPANTHEAPETGPGPRRIHTRAPSTAPSESADSEACRQRHPDKRRSAQVGTLRDHRAGEKPAV